MPIALSPGLAFHHCGLLTDRPDVTAMNLAVLGYRIGESVCDNLQKAHLCMAEHPGGSPSIEIIHPFADNAGLKRLQGRKGEHIYHMCYEVGDLADTLRYLAEKCVLIHELSSRKPAALFGGRHVSFYFLEGLGLIEFLEYA